MLPSAVARLVLVKPKGALPSQIVSGAAMTPAVVKLFTVIRTGKEIESHKTEFSVEVAFLLNHVSAVNAAVV